MWRAQTSFGLDTTALVVKKISIFEGVSEVTLNKYVYELMQIKTYEKHSMIYNDCSFMREFLKTNEETHKKDLDELEGHNSTLAKEYSRY